MFSLFGTKYALFNRWNENNYSPADDYKNFLSSILGQEGKPEATLGDRIFQWSQWVSASAHYVELFNRVKASLSALQAYAFLSLDNSKDKELAENFYKIVNADIEKTISLLDCFNDYINFSTPWWKRIRWTPSWKKWSQKTPGVQFQEKKINVIKKQFEKGRFQKRFFPNGTAEIYLNSVIEYVLLSMPLESNVGFLTRIFDIEALNEWRKKCSCKKDGKYLEIPVGWLTSYEEVSGKEVEFVPVIPTHPQQEGATELILSWPKRLLGWTQGVMSGNTSDEDKRWPLSLWYYPLKEEMSSGIPL